MNKALLIIETCALLTVILNGCATPPRAVVATAPAVCPAGYKAVSSHEATHGPSAGHGFVLVPYTANGKAMETICTPEAVSDPRINHGRTIPEAKQ